MRRTLLPALALLIGCATGAAVRDLVAPARAQGQNGASYEYTFEQANELEDQQTIATKFGRQGWRLVTVSVSRLYFERPLPR